MVAVELLVFGKTPWIGGFVTNLTMLQEFIGFANLDNVFWSLTSSWRSTRSWESSSRVDCCRESRFWRRSGWRSRACGRS